MRINFFYIKTRIRVDTRYINNNNGLNGMKETIDIIFFLNMNHLK